MAEQKLTIRQAAEYTGLPTGAIAYAAKCDPPRLRGYKSSDFGPWYFTRTDLDAWVDSMANAPADSPAPTRNTKRRRATAASR